MTPEEIETLRTEYRARLLRGDWVGGPLTEMKIDIMIKEEEWRQRLRESDDECAAIALKRRHQIKLVKIAIGAVLALGALLTFATMDFNASPERAIQTAK
jgi:hypothetical protein